MSQQFVGADPNLAEPAFRIFTNVAKAWSLTKLEQSVLLGQSVDDAFALHRAGIVDGRWAEVLERVSYVISIYRALHTLFPNPQHANEWIRRPNEAALFRGEPAVKVICSGRLSDLAEVLAYLDSQGIAAP